MTAEATVRSVRNRRLRRVAGVVLSLAFVAIAFAFILPTIADYSAVGKRLGELSAFWLAVLSVATALNIATFPLPWMVVLPRLGFFGALRMTQASTALISVVPGGAPMGMAISFGMLRSRNITSRQAGLAVALTGLWNQLAILLFPLVALVVVTAQGSLPGPLEWAAAAGLVLALVLVAPIALALARPEALRRVGARLRPRLERAAALVRWRPRLASGPSLLSLREETLGLLRRRWFGLSAATLANLLTGYVMLDFCLRAVGITLAELSVAETFAAWSVGRVLGSLPLTPGGLGVVDLGLVGLLVGFAGGHDAQVVAGVLAYRFLSLVPTLVLGAVAGVTWKLGR